MAIYITGDTHGDFQRFGSKYFPQQKEMSREDYVVIAGDFGVLWDETPESAVTVKQQSRLEGVNRYSNRRDSAMTLRGIRGKVWFEGADEETMKLLFAGELLHVGKNTSFGFGEFEVQPV